MLPLVIVSLGLVLYTYVAYPALLQLLRLVRPGVGPGPVPHEAPAKWPAISIVLPVYNEAGRIAQTLEHILAIDYPSERRQILVVLDACTDGTEAIVAQFAARGVELLRHAERRGKTAAENAATVHLRGDIIVNTDASVRIDRAAVKHLVAAFADPSIGVASGRDVSVSLVDDRTNPGEQAYVGYDMWVRDLETRVSGIVGASGCLYAIRRHLYVRPLPEHLSRDFGAALVAREHGYRAVSVPAAVCFVPRSPALRREYRRKVRTMARGLRTLWHKRALLDVRRHGLFAWMLWSHKLCRWLVPWAVVVTLGAALATPHSWWAAAMLAPAALATLTTAVGWAWPPARGMPRVIALPSYAVAGNVAALAAWLTALGGAGTAVWEPTRRELRRSHGGV